MAGSPTPSRPGWYQDPDVTTRLRYWDGRRWSDDWRPRPAWAGGAIDVEVSDHDFAASVIEGPAHFQELEASTPAGGSLLRRLPWVRPGMPPLPRRSGHHRRSASGPPPPDAPVVRGLGPARRPVIFFASLAFMAIGLFALTLLVTRPMSQAVGAGAAAKASFVSQANQQCANVLPAVYGPLSAETDGPLVIAAASRVSALGERLSQLSAGPLPAYRLHQWLAHWKLYAQDEQRFGAVIGPSVSSGGQPRSRHLSGSAARNADRYSASAYNAGVSADTFAKGIGLSSCALLGIPPSDSATT